MKKRFLTAVSVLVFAAALAAAALRPGAISPESYRESVRFLASEKMRGRLTGTPELDRAARWIASEFRRLGLKPVPGQRDYFQRFEVTVGARMGKDNRLTEAEGGAKPRSLAFGQDFQPMNFSASGRAAGEVVFAGYGITAPEYGYDDYAGIDVKGRLVLLLRHEPQEFDEKSPFAGRAFTSHAQVQNKAVNAKFHGAAAVLFVNDLPNHSGDEDRLDRFSARVGPTAAGIPFVQVRAAVAERWLRMAGISLKQWIEETDRTLKPKPVAIPGLRVELAAEVVRQQRFTPNVAAYLPGETDEYVILGAHFDHLGLGEQSSLAPDLAGKAIHHGADDNASGTAGLLELAAYFAGRPKQKRGILFLAFSGEELGLLGSNYYVNHPLLPLEKAVAMINMDMIGRIQDNRVYIGGSGTGDSLKRILEEAMAGSPLQFDFSDQGGYGSSDHFSFVNRGVPVLFFFSGLHADYHKPSDTWEKINAIAAAQMLEVVARAAEKLANDDKRPQYVKVQMPQQPAMASSSGSGAWFGSVPDMGESKDGFRLSDVMKGSPAEEAGLKGGDVIIEFDGKPITNLYDFTYVLRTKKPGDTVTVKYRRGGEVRETQATLRSRSQMR
ncbi:MAG: M28 family peptidase [Bryobacteraceae bacterium]|nr:M28 family peptidase [Bryobacteraceae bacterium]